MRIYDVGAPWIATGDIFAPWGAEIIEANPGKDNVEEIIKSCQLVSYGGGGDIHPAVYGHKNVASSVSGVIPSHRDNFELLCFKLARKYDIPQFGICRGLQFLCVGHGGSLIQHVDNHAGGEHEITVPFAISNNKIQYPRTMFVNSLHHQMVDLDSMDSESWKCFGWTTNRSNKFLFDNNRLRIRQFQIPEFNPEIVAFYDRSYHRGRVPYSLGVQFHPEFYPDVQAQPVKVTRRMIAELLLQDPQRAISEND